MSTTIQRARRYWIADSVWTGDSTPASHFASFSRRDQHRDQHVAALTDAAEVITRIDSTIAPAIDIPRLDATPVLTARAFRVVHAASPATDRRTRALETVKGICVRLAVSERDLARLAHMSRNSFRNWRDGASPHPATLRSLLELGAVLDVVATVEGNDLARWARQPSPSGDAWIAVLGDEDGLARVLAAYRERLPRPPQPRLVDVDDDELGEGALTRGLIPVTRRPGPRRRPR